SLVRERRGLHGVLRRLRHLEEAGLGGQHGIATNAVNCSVACRRDEPGARVGGVAVARPSLRSNREGLLYGFLGQVEVAEEADQRCEHTAPLVAKRLLERHYHCMIGRTSMAPPRRAAGIA